MKYLKRAANGPSGFSASFTNGASTKSSNAANFFIMMQGKGAAPEELAGYIHVGKMVDPANDWAEIQRIAVTFAPVEKLNQ